MPYHPPPHFVERFAPWISRDKEARHYLQQFNSDVFGWMAPLVNSIDEKKKAILDGMYNAEVAHQDELVGAFFKQLRASGVLDHTLLMICADHGEHLGEKQLIGHSVSLYETLVHVPLLIRDPSGDFPRGTIVDRMVSTRRIFHTALTATGSSTLAEESVTLAQNTNSEPEPIFALGVTAQNLLNLMQRRRPDLIQARHWDVPRQAVWQGHYKLIQSGGDEVELYNVIDDPQEKVDLQHILPEEVDELRSYLLNFTRQMSAGDVSEVKPREVVAGAFSDPQVYRRLRDLGYLE
jgi:arylsulfatase A-like enzyme